MIEHVRKWADEHGFELEQDAGRNVVVRVPATSGRESAPTVTLQGHLDMVCERESTSPNDPAEGRIVLVRDGEWLKADGTTLGADDGVAIAAMMALVEDESLPHGPLELLMTVAEEVGSGRERARPEARHGLGPRRLRQRGGRTAHGRLRRQHGHVGESTLRATPPRRTPSRCPSRSQAARADIGIGHRARPLECGQGPRTCTARGAREGTVPPRLAERRQEPQCDPADASAVISVEPQPRTRSARRSRRRTRLSGTRLPRSSRASRSGRRRRGRRAAVDG